MKLIGISQRVELFRSRGEERDCLDRNWWQFNSVLGAILLPLPNIARESAGPLATRLGLSAIILSGGNTISDSRTPSEDCSPERDSFEKGLLDWAIGRRLPVLGICRGAQMINHYFGGTTRLVENHVAQDHEIFFMNDWENLPNQRVNSFHEQAIFPDSIGSELIPLAVHKDGTTEAFRHKKYNVTGIVWHPEREDKPSQLDLQIMNDLMG